MYISYYRDVRECSILSSLFSHFCQSLVLRGVVGLTMVLVVCQTVLSIDNDFVHQAIHKLIVLEQTIMAYRWKKRIARSRNAMVRLKESPF